MARPVGVVVSIASVSDRKATPRAFRSSKKADEVTQRPAQTVELPDRERVALHKSLEAPGQFRPLDVRPGCLCR